MRGGWFTVLTFLNQNSTLIHKFVGTRLVKVVLTLVNFAGVAANDNVEGHDDANKFRRNVVVSTAAAETYIIHLYLLPQVWTKSCRKALKYLIFKMAQKLNRTPNKYPRNTNPCFTKWCGGHICTVRPNSNSPKVVWMERQRYDRGIVHSSNRHKSKFYANTQMCWNLAC